jgi:hypothetical protein
MNITVNESSGVFIPLATASGSVSMNQKALRTNRLLILSIVISACALLSACARETTPAGPKFTGRLLLLAGDNPNGADLIELTAASDSTYKYTRLTDGVFEAVASPDQTRLLYATKDEILLRDLRTGNVKSLVKGDNYCLEWSPDGNRFSYKQKLPTNEKAPEGETASRSKLYVSDLEGRTKLIWEDITVTYSAVSAPGQSPVLVRAAGESGCAHWIAPDRFIFDRFLGAPPGQNAGKTLKPNTTTLAILSDSVKFQDTQRKWSWEAKCPVGSAALLRPADQDQPILIARSLDNLKTLDPSPASCSGCRFVGFAARSCLPFFVQDATSTTTELVSLNPTNWQRQRGASITQVFSPNARMLIKSSARLMVAGDAPAWLLLIDTESGDVVPLVPKGELRFPQPVVWIEN